MENLIIKNDLILLNDKSRTYFHSGSGIFLVHHSFLISPGTLVLTHVVVITFHLFWRMMDHLQRRKLAKANWNKFHHLCSTRLHYSVMNDADGPMSLFTSILKDTAEETAVPKRFNKPWFLIFVNMQSKSATGLWRGSDVNQPREPEYLSQY